MTDAQSTDRSNQPPAASTQADPANGSSLGVLSLSSSSDEQPEFDPSTALIAAATATDGSVEEVVLLRLLVLRRAHPDAVVRTHLERVEDEQVVVRAEVVLTTGASASAYATAGGGVASIERTEYRALGRALDALGEAVLVDIARPGDETLATSSPVATGWAPGTEAATVSALPDLDDDWDDDDESGEGDDVGAPLPEREIPPSRFSAPTPRGRSSAQAGPAPAAETPDREPPVKPAVVDAVRRANLRRHGAGQPEAVSARNDDTGIRSGPETLSEPAHPAPAQPVDDDDTPLENYSWTAFWRVARPLGLDKMKVEEIIGGPINPLTPLQVRDKLKAAGVDI
ncbi:MAG: hypothetical protein WBA46_11060 [Thermomicrobiales bacterium]